MKFFLGLDIAKDSLVAVVVDEQGRVVQHRSFSNTPLTLLTTGGVLLLALSFIFGFILIVLRLWIPDIAPRGATTLLLFSLFFGAINLFAVGLVGEYVAKIMEEVKGRPRLIRAGLIRDGKVSELQSDGSLRP